MGIASPAVLCATSFPVSNYLKSCFFIQNSTTNIHIQDLNCHGTPNTGFLAVNAGSWFSVGGTSAGAPQWAALVAIANQGRAAAGNTALSTGQTLSTVYANPSAFHDITRGSTGAYAVVDGNGNVVGQITVAAGPGYDMVTGLGVPNVAQLIQALTK